MKKLLKTRSVKADTSPTPVAMQRPQRILVVDDGRGIRQLGAAVLIRQGYHVDAARDNTTGWKALRSRTYDLLIADLDMPRLSGLKLVKKLRDARMALPVIVASSTMTPQELNRNPWLQLSGALLKPFSPDQLLQTVQSVLRTIDGGREQIAAPPNGQSQPSAGGLRLY